MDRTAAMDYQTGSSKPLPPTPPSENPIVAMGRKVKSKLSTSDNEPSVRLVRTNTREPGAPLQDAASLRPPPTQEDTSGIGNGVTTVRSRAGSTVRSMFSRKEKSTEDVESFDEYDQSTVDLMDVMGMYFPPTGTQISYLILCRPRSGYPFNTHQRTKFVIRPPTRKICQPASYLSSQ